MARLPGVAHIGLFSNVWAELNGEEGARENNAIYQDADGNLRNAKGVMDKAHVVGVLLQQNATHALKRNTLDDAVRLGRKWTALLRSSGLAMQYYAPDLGDRVSFLSEHRAQDAAAAVAILRDQPECLAVFYLGREELQTAKAKDIYLRTRRAQLVSAGYRMDEIEGAVWTDDKGDLHNRDGRLKRDERMLLHIFDYVHDLVVIRLV